MAGSSSNLQHGMPKVLISVVVLFLILFGVSLAFYFSGVGTRPGNQTSATKTSATNESAEPATNAVEANPLTTDEPSVITSRSGAVTRITKNGLRFETPVLNTTTGLYELQELEAVFTNDTTFTEVDRTTPPSAPLPGQANETAVAETVIDGSVIVRGDVVDVITAENISGLKRFTVVKVRRFVFAQ